MAKKWPEKVVQMSFIKGHSFPISLYLALHNLIDSPYYVIHENLQYTAGFYTQAGPSQGLKIRGACSTRWEEFAPLVEIELIPRL